MKSVYALFARRLLEKYSREDCFRVVAPLERFIGPGGHEFVRRRELGPVKLARALSLSVVHDRNLPSRAPVRPLYPRSGRLAGPRLCHRLSKARLPPDMWLASSPLKRRSCKNVRSFSHDLRVSHVANF